MAYVYMRLPVYAVEMLAFAVMSYAKVAARHASPRRILPAKIWLAAQASRAEI